MTGTIQPPTPRLIATFNPLAWQVAPWRDRSLVMLLTGSAGGGKSLLAAEKLHGYCQKYPNSMALAVRKTRESMVNSTVLILEQQVIANDTRVHHNRQANRFEYSNGSILAYGGMKDQQQREQIRSIGLQGGVGICWMEEANAFTEADFNEVLTRMRATAAPWRQVILTTNPDAPSHWIFKRLIQGREAKVYESGAGDNQHNPPEYLDTLQSLTGVQKLRLAGGKWVQAEGVVYGDFNPLIHVIERFEIPASWRRVRSIDFGFTNPFCCQWWAIDGDGRMFLYREIYHTRRLVEDHTAQIVALSAGERIEQTVADHDAEDRATAERHGVSTVRAYKAIQPGIQNVQSRLIAAGDGRCRLYIFADALVEQDAALDAASSRPPTCTADEIPGYVWPRGQDGKPLKEEPVDLNNHGCDAMRYAAAYVDDLSTESASFDGGFYTVSATQ